MNEKQWTMSMETAATRLRDAARGAVMAGRLARERHVANRTAPLPFRIIEPEGVAKSAGKVQGGRVHGGGGLAEG